MGQMALIREADRPDVGRFLARQPIDNIALASRFAASGRLDPGLGGHLWGYWSHRQLKAVLYDGMTIYPVSDGPAILAAFARHLNAKQAHPAAIVGRRGPTMGLWRLLSDQRPGVWGQPRLLRDHQQVMAIDCRPAIEPATSLEIVGLRQLNVYHQASRLMYIEELEQNPSDLHGAYRDHVASLINRQCALAVIRADQVMFKADIVASADDICQIGGVWLAPPWRGKGWSAPLMAGVVAHCLQRFRRVCLYVNQHNRPALACYRRVGFTLVGECASIVY
ncbi:MAG: GNAT family N-acetyltransferase [Propionibacteriaceae bacterium]|jgi:ribosomal protein S18 acetylase RimI-like enzyme|nr:GNAT family N-acetyltransferase [Propionibacteriaceae bacterium]